jgi:hypothetical protein
MKHAQYQLQIPQAGRVTNVDLLNQLYRERKDDDASIRLFIAAQPKQVE